MNPKNQFIRILACFLALAMVCGSLVSLTGAGVSVVSAEGTRAGVDSSYAANNHSNAVLAKTAALQADGTYRIDLSAFTKGDIVVEAEPMDIILLLDQSYSMADTGSFSYVNSAGQTVTEYYTCDHTAAVRQAASALIDRIHAQAVQYDVEHRMAIAAYGCENSKIAQELAGRIPYTGSELYVGSAAYRFSGRSTVAGTDVVYERNRNTGTVTRTEGNSHYHYNPNTYFNELDAGGDYSSYPNSSAQAHYDDCMLSLNTQADALKASLQTYNPDKANQNERAGTAMQVGMKMVEGILDAYRPDPETHENMYRVGNEWKNRKKVVIVFTDGYVGESSFSPNWANECIKSAFRIKGDTYGEPATIFTVGLVFERMNDAIYSQLKFYAPYGDYYDTETWFGPRYIDGGLWNSNAYDSGRVTYEFLGELFPRHYYSGVGQELDPHRGLLNQYLSYISSNYIPKPGSSIPASVIYYYEDDRDLTTWEGGNWVTTHIHKMQLHLEDLSAWWDESLTPNTQPYPGHPGIIKNNYYIDTNNALDETSQNGALNIARLIDAFNLITTETTTVTQELLDVNAVLRDALSDKFKMPADFSLDNIEIKVVPFTGNIVNGEYIFDEESARDLFPTPSGKAANVRFDVTTGVITVTGYDYAQCIEGRAGGSKIVVTLSGIEALSDTVGMDIPTNDPTQTGIYEGNNIWDPYEDPEAPDNPINPGDPGTKPDKDPLLYFPLPKVDIRERYVVYDFCRPVEEENPELFFGNSGDVEELLALGECYKKQNPSAYAESYVKRDAAGDELYVAEKHSGNGAKFEIKQISYSDFELGALLRLKNGAGYEWCKLTFLPATNVHYEETMLRYSDGSMTGAINSDYEHWMPLTGLNSSWAEGGSGSVATQQSAANVLYGFDSSYNKFGNSGNSDSNGAAAHAEVDSTYADLVKAGEQQWPTAHFRYTGTGFDIISRSGANTGVLAVDVVPHGADRKSKVGVKNKDYAHLIVDTYYKDAGEGDSIILHQIPVLRLVDMNWGDYDVYIAAVYDKLFDHLTPSKGAIDEKALEQLRIPGLPEVEYELVSVAPDGMHGELEPSRAPEYGSFDVYLDAVRVYEPRGKTGRTAIDERAYRDANEYNPQYCQIRSILLNKLPDFEGYGGGVNGVLYIDGQGGVINVDKYEEHGPNNETYLKPKEKHQDGSETERAFAFTIKNWQPGKSRLHISAKAPYGKVHMRVNGMPVCVNGQEVNIISATEMYYDVTDIMRQTGDEGHVVIEAYLDGDATVPADDEGDPDALPDPATHHVLSLVNIKFIPEEDAASPEPTPTPDPTSEPDPTPTPAPAYRLVTFKDTRNDDDPSNDSVVVQVWVNDGDQLEEGMILPDYGENAKFYDPITGTLRFVWPTVPQAPAGYVNNINNGHGGWYYDNYPITADTDIMPDRELANTDSKAIITFTVNGNPNMQLLISSDLTTNTIPAGPSTPKDQTAQHNAMSEANLPYMIPGPTKDDVFTSANAYGEIQVDAGTYRLGSFAKIDMGTRVYWYMMPGVTEVTLEPGETLHATFDANTGIIIFEKSGSPNPVIVPAAHGGGAVPATCGSIRAESVRGETDESDCVAVVTADTFLFAEAVLVGMPGDANHDRVVDLTDALRIMRHALGADCGFDLYELYCADINKDGAIDLVDATAVMRASLTTE